MSRFGTGRVNSSNRNFALQYPLDLTGDLDTSYFFINILKKEPRSLGTFDPLKFNNGRPDDVFGSNLTATIGTIILPMPLGVADGNNVAWADGSFNFLEGQAANAISNIFTEFQNNPDILDAAKKSGSIAGQLGKDLTQQLQSAGIQGAALTAVSASIIKGFGSNITPNQLLSRTTGQVLNPNLELLFDGPTLRNHEFSFKLTPRSKTESDVVKRIIFELKKSMAARASSTGALVATPYVFKIGFKQGPNDHPFLFSMRLCGMKSLNVNYSASTQENYSSYFDGTPTSLDLSMSFTELSPVYAEDYDEFEGGERGVGW